MNQHCNVMEIPQTRIFRYCGSLNFATSLFFRRALYSVVGLNKIKQQNDQNRKLLKKYVPVTENDAKETKTNTNMYENTFEFLILDFSMLGHIDVAGCSMLTEISNELKTFGSRLLLSSPMDRVYDTLIHSMALSEGPFEIFPTLHDAVEYANAYRTV